MCTSDGVAAVRGSASALAAVVLCGGGGCSRAADTHHARRVFALLVGRVRVCGAGRRTAPRGGAGRLRGHVSVTGQRCTVAPSHASSAVVCEARRAASSRRQM